MSRLLALSLPTLMLVACTNEAYEGTYQPDWWQGSDEGDAAEADRPPPIEGRLDLQLSSEVGLDAAGIALYGPDSGIMGVRYHYVSPVTCEFTTAGEVLYDYDYHGGDERVDDYGDPGGGPVAVVVTGDGILLHTPYTPPIGATLEGQMWHGGDVHYPIYGVVEARIGDGELVALRQTTDRCVVSWLDSGAQVEVPDSTCDRGFDVDPATSTAWVTSEADGLFRVTADSAERVGDAGNRLVWDETAQLLYTSTADGGSVVARSADGQELWSTRVAGMVRDMAPLSGHNAVAVLNHEAIVDLLDVHTGEIVGRLSLPDTARELAASPGGETLVLARTGVASVFKVVTTE